MMLKTARRERSSGTGDTEVPVLALRNVSKSFGAGPATAIALRKVSLRAEAGEFVAVMGPSGSGKSTLVHIAAGLDVPDHGKVVLDGAPMPAQVKDRRWAEARRRRIGVVFQRFNLVPGLTASENVALPLELDGWGSVRARSAARDAMGRTGTAELADRFPHEMSGGQEQRVGIARAIVGSRGLVLADEPTGALDSASAESVVELLATLAGDGVSVVLVTHDSRLAGWSDRVVFLRDGAVVAPSTPAAKAPVPPSEPSR